MIPTITNQIRESTLKDYLGYGLVAFLIYKPDLGYDDTPTEAEYNNRKNLTMRAAVDHEVGGASLNGYKRFYIEVPTIKNDLNSSTLTIRAEFEALGGNIGPFSHVCVARGANVFDMRPDTGNNRGDYQGQLILVQPVTSRSLSNGVIGLLLEPPEKYIVTIPIQLNNLLY